MIFSSSFLKTKSKAAWHATNVLPLPAIPLSNTTGQSNIACFASFCSELSSILNLIGPLGFFLFWKTSSFVGFWDIDFIDKYGCNSLKLIDATTKTLGIIQGVIIPPLQALLIIADTNPPITNPIPGGVSKRLDKTISTLSAVNAGVLAILIILKQVLVQAIDLLNLLDALVQKCYPDADQERVALELTALTNQQSTQTSPVVTNVNGFEMGVITEVTDKPLKRRRAIARNKQGVVMLQGEFSFSSIDQILIDELVFYIQQNNLKAD